MPCHRNIENATFLPVEKKESHDARSLENAPRVSLRILKSEKYFEISRISYLGLSPTDSFHPRVSSSYKLSYKLPSSYIYSFRISSSTRGWYICYIYKVDGAAHLCKIEVRKSFVSKESTRCYENSADENVRS